jgi:hypothetical protein
MLFGLFHDKIKFSRIDQATKLLAMKALYYCNKYEIIVCTHIYYTILSVLSPNCSARNGGSLLLPASDEFNIRLITESYTST